MVLQRWYPTSDVRRVEDSQGRVWRGLGGWPLAYRYVADRIAPVDVREEDDHIVVSASIPGVRPEDIRVTTEDGLLTISAESHDEGEDKKGGYLVRERRSGEFSRSFRLPDVVDEEGAEAAYEYGVLTVSFPKQEAKRSKQLEVKVKS